MPTNRNAKEPAPRGRLLKWRENGHVGSEYYYSDLDAKQVVDAIDAITRLGGAIMFGKTTGGDAYSVMVLHGSDKVKEYPHGPDNMHALLRELYAQFTEE